MPFARLPLLHAPALALATWAGSASGQALAGYGDYLDWEGWARVTLGDRTGLASSWDRTGGSTDANWYESPPGLQLGNVDTIAATLTGPGIIFRFWMPHRAAETPFALRMYFDGESSPRIGTDSRTLLDGKYGYFAAPLVTTFAGGQVCYEPIPFEQSVRIETENRSGLWHWYQYSYRTFAPGTDLTSYSGALDPPADAARIAVAAMFQNAGQHPAGASPTALRQVTSATAVVPGGTLVTADLAGPGLVRALHLRMDGAPDAALDSLRLRVTYDAEAEPAIDAPVGWFFGAGHERAPYRSLPLGTDGPEGFYCYWPMPFHGGVRFELLNASASSIQVDSASVEYEPGAVGTDMAYLHAAASETLIEPGHDGHVLLSRTGTGHYVGNLLYAQEDHALHVFLEGDDIIEIDGTTTLNGSGLEDAYNGGFYYNWNWDPLKDEPEGPNPPSAIRPLHGILYVIRDVPNDFARADQYRWMIADRVQFSSSLEVCMETSPYAEPPGLFQSVAFWYQLPAIASGAGDHRPDARGLGLELRQSSPNPVGSSTVIRFSLSAAAHVVLEVLDVRGRRVETLAEEDRAAGAHEVRWTPAGVAGGVYFVRLSVGGESKTRKLVFRH